MKNVPAHALLFAALFAATASAQTPLPQGAAAKAKDEKASLEGRVVNASSGDPIKKASLTLASGGSPLGAVKAESDEEGRFAFRDLDAGRYTLTGDKAGFVRQAYGARSNPASGSALTLATGQQMKDLVFKMSPGAIVSGHVLDEEGEPVANAVVMAMKTLYRRGEPQLSPLGSAATNDLGEYRISGLTAGGYVLAAANRLATSGLTGASNQAAGDAPERDYVTTYYPGSADIAAAVRLQVAAGGEAGGANIRMAKADTVRVKGKVNGALEGKQVLLMLLPKGAKDSGVGITAGRSAVAKADGTFDIAGVTPGAYTLATISVDPDSSIRFASRDIQVGRQHVDGVVMALGTPGELSGAVTVDTQDQVFFKAMQVTLAAAPGAPSLTTPAGRVGDDGKFVLKNVPTGSYVVQVTGAPDNSYVKSVRFGGEEAPDGVFAFSGSAGGLQIALGLAGAQVEGVVLNADKEPAPDVTVVLIPASGRSSLYREERTGQKGRFTIKGVSPGEYRALAWEDVETAAYKDSEYLKKLDGSAEPLSLKENDHKTLSLKAIPAQP